MTDTSSRMVGVLVGNKLYRGIPGGRMGHEAIELYDVSGKEFGLQPCYFRLADISPDMSSVAAYIQTADGYRKRTLPLPQVIHNRTIHKTWLAKMKMKRLAASGRILFNQWNRYPKQYIHDLLMLEPRLWPYLPETLPATMTNLRSMMSRHESLIIKPNRGSIGRGVMKLERKRSWWSLAYPIVRNGRTRWRMRRFRNKLPMILRKRISNREFVVQQCLPLATFRGRPFDIRISVQRSKDGAWQVTGMIAKVAARGKFITNVAQGGRVMRLSYILQEYPELNPDLMTNTFTDFALLVAEHLSGQLPQLADLGLDAGMSADGTPLFIECNCKDQRYSFLEGGMPETWIATYRHPMGYARYLLDGLDG